MKKIKNEYNFSKVGKLSMKKYSFLINKINQNNEKLLNYKYYRNKLLDDYFQNLSFQVKDENDLYYKNDIFNKKYNSKIINEVKNKNKKNKNNFELKSACSYLNKEKNIKNKFIN